MRGLCVVLIVALSNLLLANCASLLFKKEYEREGSNLISHYNVDLSKNMQHFSKPNAREKRFLTDMVSFGVEMLNLKKAFRNVKQGVVNSLTCFACKFSVSLFQHFVEEGKSEEEIGHFADVICKTLRIESPRVCKGVTNSFRDEVVQVFSRIALSPKEVCGILLGDSCSKPYDPFFNWSVPLPSVPKPPSKQISAPKPGSPVLRVLHLSDTHFDHLYLEGSNANCKEPLCCRLADKVPANPEDRAGRWGDYRNCDTPLRTLEHMLKHISQNHKIDYVLWTGDIPAHDIWNQSRSDQVFFLRYISKLMSRYFKGIPIFPALGNHESFPVNSFPIPEITGNRSISWLYDELALAWRPWLPSSVLPSIKKGAYYSVKVNPGFRIISINMNYCNTLNWWLLINTTDPAQQLKWLVNELQTAEIQGEKVHIIGHIPPGASDCLQVWSQNYYKIINRYNDTIVAQFFGHTHMDEFEIFYDAASSYPTSIAYIGPSITTYDGVNPGYRIYTVDGNYPNSSRVVLDHETYYLNLTEANLTNKPIWRLEYTAKKAFNMTSLLASDWHKVVKEFLKNDNLFQKFYRYYRKMSDYFKEPCTGDCKAQLLCNLQSGRSHGSSFCRDI
uniref:Sphingomyelin phosphodiesterase n=1 Tax=Hemiscorpius lepturus TaxID=520031 RepID=A0A1L4BJ95_HEMLE|nr:venom toxin [Hemiscorpius lepturus]